MGGAHCRIYLVHILSAIALRASGLELYIALRERLALQLVEFKNATSRLYKDKARFSSFPKRDFIERYIGEYGYSSASQQVFNDVAFFWQQAGFNTDAIWLLKKVISENPKRTVAYLNLADAYWEAGDKTSAGKNYKVYTDLMSENGKQAKVPDRVRQRATTQQ